MYLRTFSVFSPIRLIDLLNSRRWLLFAIVESPQNFFVFSGNHVTVLRLLFGNVHVEDSSKEEELRETASQAFSHKLLKIRRRWTISTKHQVPAILRVQNRIKVQPSRREQDEVMDLQWLGILEVLLGDHFQVHERCPELQVAQNVGQIFLSHCAGRQRDTTHVDNSKSIRERPDEFVDRAVQIPHQKVIRDLPHAQNLLRQSLHPIKLQITPSNRFNHFLLLNHSSQCQCLSGKKMELVETFR